MDQTTVTFWPKTDHEDVDRNLLDVKEFCDTILATAGTLLPPYYAMLQRI